MKLNDDYIIVEKIEEEAKEGFQTVEVQDPFTYKGRVKRLPARPVYLGNDLLQLGETVFFTKYSPDTHEIEGDKLVKTTDILYSL